MDKERRTRQPVVSLVFNNDISTTLSRRANDIIMIQKNEKEYRRTTVQNDEKTHDGSASGINIGDSLPNFDSISFANRSIQILEDND